MLRIDIRVEESVALWEAYLEGRIAALNTANAEIARLKALLANKKISSDTDGECITKIKEIKETLKLANKLLDEKTPKFIASENLISANKNFNDQINLLNQKISDNKNILLINYAKQLNQIDRTDKDCLDAGTYGIQCVIAKLNHPDADIRPIHLEHHAHTSPNHYQEIAGIAMMTGAVLLGLTSLILIATIKLSPAGIAGLAGSAALFALGASKIGGITLLGVAIGSGVGFFGGDRLRQKGAQTKNLTQETVRVLQNRAI